MAGSAKSSTEILAEGRGEKSVFAHMRKKVFPYRYKVTLHLNNIVGGVPKDPKVAEGWLRSKLVDDKDDLIRDMVATTMVEMGSDVDDAIEEAAKNKHLNGFKRNFNSELYIEGRQVKAMIKENANIKWPKERWGTSKKGTRGYFAEHVFVEEDEIPLGVKEEVVEEIIDSEEVAVQKVTDPRFYINQRFVHTWRGSGIQYEEVVNDAEVTFHILTDHEFDDEQWATLFLSAEQNGLGAARSQGFGTFQTIEFDKVKHPNA